MRRVEHATVVVRIAKVRRGREMRRRIGVRIRLRVVDIRRVSLMSVRLLDGKNAHTIIIIEGERCSSC